MHLLPILTSTDAQLAMGHSCGPSRPLMYVVCTAQDWLKLDYLVILVDF